MRTVFFSAQTEQRYTFVNSGFLHMAYVLLFGAMCTGVHNLLDSFYNNNNNNNNKANAKTRNTENVAYENRSDPCGCWCAWYSEEGYGRKHQESIRESYYDRDSKDLHAGICTNP